jgi:hypothetical protein
VLARATAERAGEDAAAGVLKVLVESIAGQGLLPLDELGRALHEGDEEQAAEQRARPPSSLTACAPPSFRCRTALLSAASGPD